MDRTVSPFVRTALIGALMLSLVAAGAFVALVAIGFTGARSSHDSLEQGQRNQQHIDCIVSVFARTDPPGCREVKADLIRRGMLPTTTTTTGG
jgi:hypothetical protein